MECEPLPKPWREVTGVVASRPPSHDAIIFSDPQEWLPLYGTWVQRGWLMEYWLKLIELHHV
jgi:hypothetical protein